jgi:hypothetical protein
MGKNGDAFDTCGQNLSSRFRHALNYIFRVTENKEAYDPMYWHLRNSTGLNMEHQVAIKLKSQDCWIIPLAFLVMQEQ